MGELLQIRPDALPFKNPDIGDTVEARVRERYRFVTVEGIVVRADYGEDPKIIVRLEDGTYLTDEELARFEPSPQGSYLGKLADVSFGYNDPNEFKGIVVRHDEEFPHIILIELIETGRVVYDYECHYFFPPDVQ